MSKTTTAADREAALHASHVRTRLAVDDPAITPVGTAAEREAALSVRRQQADQRAAEASAKLATLDADHHRLLVSGALSAADALTADMAALRARVDEAHAERARLDAALSEINRERQRDERRIAHRAATATKETAIASRDDAIAKAAAALEVARAAVLKVRHQNGVAERAAFEEEALAHELRVFEVGQARAEEERVRFYWAPRWRDLLAENLAWVVLTSPERVQINGVA